MNETEYYKKGPSEWNYKKLGDVVTFQGGSQPAKKYFSNDKSEGMIRLIQIRDYKNDNFITYVPKELCRRFCDVDDIMIGRYGPPIFQILRGIEGAYNVALIKAIPNEEIINKNYLYYFIKNEHLFKLIDGLSQRTSGQTGIDMDVLKKYIIPIPNLTEQEKIAEILSTVDKQIENTEKLIQKNQELKKGLMQQLLTKGIGHTEFKKTELGYIPKEWEIMSLGDVSIGKGEYGIGASAVEYIKNKPRYLRITDIGDKCNLLYDDIKGLNDDNFEKYLLKYGDVVFARTGNTTGKAYVYNEKDGELVYAGFLIKFKMNHNIIKAEFFKYIVQSKRYWNWVNVMSTRSGQPGINSTEYSKFLIQIPKLNEQEKIAKIISSIDEQIDDYQSRMAKLEKLKKGLMQNLLTGKLRVI
ncbi:restriction endonuclease subunit S [Clostridium perfringens]|uniref:restriction endonuclease subunit S n=1 Tax=Clostridium perfringens TaxID=1502 RepID=UPI001ABAAA76|nr:restriction endonuclease subunit S [Clostridium perfringens]MBO3429718.1 restriction endonuclease subunit S [Clostridium perfringens]